MEPVPPAVFKRALYVPNKTMMGPGPSNCPSRVLESMSNPVLGHLQPECLQIMDDVKAGLKYLFQTTNDATLCISGSGHAGMEASLCNLIEDGDVVLFGVTGLWGQRASDIAKRYGADIRYVESRFGRSLTLDEVESAFKEHKPKILFMAQGDSSTGILQSNLREMGELCRKFDAFFVVDTVASLGGTDFQMDDWKIDVTYTGSQKVLGGPPGITPISFNNRAIACVKARKSKVKSYYFDILLLGQYWNCFGTPRIYHHTISSTLLYGLREAIAQVCNQGLRNVIQRHKDASERLQYGMEDIGLEFFVPNANDRLSTVNTIKVPASIDWRKIVDYVMIKHGLEISGGLGPTADQVFRIGIMGVNATNERVDLVINILHEAMHSTRLRRSSKI